MTEKYRSAHLRGPLVHSVRDQIIQAATEHFRRYGYEKTTVSNIAKSIGFSKAYIYKFFSSKQAIGEVICANRIAAVMGIVEGLVLAAPTASGRLLALFCGLHQAGGDLFFHGRGLCDVASVAARDQWVSVSRHQARLREAIKIIILQGREAGEFERKTPLDEVVDAIYVLMQPCINSVLLQRGMGPSRNGVAHLSALILRSLES